MGHLLRQRIRMQAHLCLHADGPLVGNEARLALARAADSALELGLAALGCLALGLADNESAAADVYGLVEFFRFCHGSFSIARYARGPWS